VSIWQTNEGVSKYQLEKVFGPSYSTDSIQGSMNAISSNPDTAVPVMMRDLNVAGFQKIMDEAHRQVNAFRR